VDVDGLLEQVDVNRLAARLDLNQLMGTVDITAIVTRVDVNQIVQAVDVDGVITTLLERNLIRAVARKDVPGRPFLYGTTVEFLQLFNLKDLSQLPTLKEMEDITLPEIAGDVIALDQGEES